MKSILDDIDEAIQSIAFFKSVPQWQQKAEARLAKKLQALYAGAERAVLEQIKIRGIPSDPMARRNLLSRLSDVESAMGIAIGEEIEGAAKHGRNKAVDDLRKAGKAVPRVPKLADQLMRNLRNQGFNASQKTLKRHIGNVMDTLADAYSQGLGIDDAAKLISDQFTNMKDHELVRIARTEINTAQHKVTHETIKNLGGQYEMWIAELDDRVRESHEDLHGEIVRVGDTFSNGLQHPGDRSGPLEEFINCRCRLVPFIMPPDKMAPPGMSRFREEDLIDKI